jgi:sulfatase modifying factor 1
MNGVTAELYRLMKRLRVARQWFVLSLVIGLGWLLLAMGSNGAIAAPSDSLCPNDMVFIPGGTFTMGSDNPDFVEEQTAVDVTVSHFCIEPHEVTNAEFAAFVEATGYTTVAERPLSQEQFPDLPEEQRAAGSLVFEPPNEGVEQVAYLSWWHWTPGANWRHPYGPDSDIAGKADHPVVHIAYEDAVAYADWMGRTLPTEAQWEYAARGGLESKTYTWGDAYSADQANTWQGLFPFFNTKADGYLGTAPVQSFPPNGYGLYDMTGNVWELTADWFTVFHDGKAHSQDPTGPSQADSYDPKKPGDGAVHVIKGGSYLCAKNYCSRYRPAARESQAPDTGTTHIGFRLVAPIAG